MSTKLKLIVNNPELLPDAFLDEVIAYYNMTMTIPKSKDNMSYRDREAIARWFGNGLCNTAS